MKKKYLLTSLLALPLLFSLTSCNTDTEEITEVNADVVLNVYNCADYICEDSEDGDGVIKQFQDYCLETFGTSVYVKYSTYETNEDLYNQLRAGGVQYDLVCPSEYMIGKMIQNDMLERIDPNYQQMDNYNTYGSSYVHSIFDNLTETVKDSGQTYKFSEYAVPYMWGTMGFMYDPNNLSLEDVSSWSLVWDTSKPNQTSLKDSIRDTYAVTTLYVYSEELKLAKTLLDEGLLTTEQYNDKVTEIMNRCDDKTISLAEASLKEAKKNVYEFEVDTGKENIVKGKYYANVCWSGDAVYAMELASEEDFSINYMVPLEGSNVWFDGWVMPKGANKEWAQRLMDYLCDPSIASQNMDYVGYTSAIAGQDIWELANDWYDEYEEGNDDLIAYDVSYFFEGTGIVDPDTNLPIEEFIIYTSEPNGGLYAQYPDAETINRCAVMKDFGDQLDSVNTMWIHVKGNDVSWVIVVFIIFVVLLVGYFEVKNIIANKARKHRNRTR